MIARRAVHGNRRASPLNRFNGNFAGLPSFAAAYQVLQFDRGATYAGTLHDVGGAGPVITAAGSLTGPPVPIWVKATSSGALGVWTYEIYYDLGSTPAMSGISTGTLVLTGAGDGVTLTINAGAATSGNFWKLKYAAIADQSPNNKTALQVSAPAQPLFGLLGTRTTATFEASRSTYLRSPTLALPAPATTPHSTYLVFRWTGTVGTQAGVFGGSTGHAFYSRFGNPTNANDPTMYNNGAFANGQAGKALNQWYRAIVNWTGSTSDALKVGSTAAVTGTNAGNSADSDMSYGGVASIAFPANVEIALVAWVPGAVASFPDVDSAVSQYFQGIVQL